MSRGSKGRLEAFALQLAQGATPVEAALKAGYPKGLSLASNARKRAQRKDVKAMVEAFKAPAIAAVQEQIAMDALWANRRLYDEITSKHVDDLPSPSEFTGAIMAQAKLMGWLAPEKHEYEHHGLGDRIDEAFARAQADRSRRADPSRSA